MRELSDMEASAAAWSSALLRHYCQARLADATDGLAVVFDHELRVRVAQGTTIAAAAGMVGRLMPDVMSTESWERVRGPYEAALTGTPDTRSSQRGRQRTRSLPVRCWPWTGCRPLPVETLGRRSITDGVRPAAGNPGTRWGIRRNGDGRRHLSGIS
jgi:hypothetical protein